MYRKDTDGWLKHWDFILLDMICLQLAFVLAYGLSGYGFNPYQTMLYRNMSIYIEDDYLIIKSDIETTKYQIDSYYLDKNGKKLDTFDVIVDGKIQTATSVEDKFCKAFFITEKGDKFFTSFFDYK